MKGFGFRDFLNNSKKFQNPWEQLIFPEPIWSFVCEDNDDDDDDDEDDENENRLCLCLPFYAHPPDPISCGTRGKGKGWKFYCHSIDDDDGLCMIG